MPPGRGDRRARAAACSRSSRSARTARRAPSPWRRRRRVLAALRRARRGPRHRRRRRRVGRRDDDAARRLRAGGRRRRATVYAAAAAQHRPARVRAAPVRRAADRRREGRVRERRRPRPLDGRRRVAGRRRAPSSTVGGLPTGCRARTGRGGLEFDPHWWHDPRNAAHAVATIRDALTQADPAAAETYRANADAYLRAAGRALDRAVARAASTAVPAAERKLVTDHDAFGYFAARYGIEVIGAVIPSQSTQAQPSAGDLADLAALIRPTGVQRGVPGGVAVARPGAPDRARDGRARRPDAVRRRARRRRLARRRRTSACCRQRRRDGRGLQRRHRGSAARRHDRRARCSEAHDLAVGYDGRPGAARARLRGRAAASASACSGPNGGGKSTLFRAVLGQLEPLAGSARGRRAASACCRRPSARASTTR